MNNIQSMLQFLIYFLLEVEMTEHINGVKM